MRIISGSLRHRAIQGTARPTRDRVREAIFNILTHRLSFQGIVVADIFSGSGAMGLESLSRGASFVVFVEQNPKAIGILLANAKSLHVDDKILALKRDFYTLDSSPKPFDLIFLDPPYHKGLGKTACKHLYEKGWITTDTLVCIESSKDDPPSLPLGLIVQKDHKLYGNTQIEIGKLSGLE